LAQTRVKHTERWFSMNCNYGVDDAQQAMFGALEVFSLGSIDELSKKADRCKSELPWLEGGWGEDRYIQECMLQVVRASTFDMERHISDNACGYAKMPQKSYNCDDCRPVALHPYKTLETFKECYGRSASRHPGMYYSRRRRRGHACPSCANIAGAVHHEMCQDLARGFRLTADSGLTYHGHGLDDDSHYTSSYYRTKSCHFYARAFVKNTCYLAAFGEGGTVHHSLISSSQKVGPGRKMKHWDCRSFGKTEFRKNDKVNWNFNLERGDMDYPVTELECQFEC